MHLAKTSFNAGLLSPQVDMRQDAASYANGCRVLQNFVPHVAGGISKRPGLKMVMPAPYNKVSSLIPFNYSTDTRFVLVFRDGYFRVLKAGKEVVVFNGLSTPPDLWSGTVRTYNAGDWVIHNDTAAGARDTYFYPAASTHSAAPGNEPPSSSWRVTYISAWVAATAYAVGNIVTSGGLHYACKTAHTSGGSFSATNWNVIGTTRLSLWVPNETYLAGDTVLAEMLVGAVTINVFGTATVPHTNETAFVMNGGWSFFTYSGLYRSWYETVPFAAGDFVSHVVSGKFRWFRCIATHSSTTATAPATTGGASKWLDISVPQTHSTASFVYYVGDYVKVGTNVYVCISNHTSSGSNTPISTSAPWKLIEGVRAWASTGAKAVGDVVVYGRDILACVIAHTPTTYMTDTERTSTLWRSPAVGTAGVRPTYWESTRIYRAGDVVQAGTAPNEIGYVCVEEHTASVTLDPTTTAGSRYWQKVSNWEPVWATATDYLKDTYVAGYKVVADYTSGASLAADLTNGNLVDSGGVPFEAQTVYGENSLGSLNTIQVNDLLWALNPVAETQLIQRVADTAWKFSPVPWDFPPMRDENVNESLTLAASAVTGDITLTASNGLFQPGMVGGYFSLSHRRDNSTTKLNLNVAVTAGLPLTVSPVLRMVGRWDLIVFGAGWVGELCLQTSKDGVNNWTTLRSWNQAVAAMRTISTTGTVTEETFFRLRKTSGAVGVGQAVLEAADSRITGVVKITEVQSSTVAKGTVIRDLFSTTATDFWSEGAYSNYRGWPRAGTLHELRIFLAGCEGEPQTLRASRTDDFFQFEGGLNDDNSLSLTIASKESNAVQWVESVNGALVVATLGEVWSVDSGTDSRGMTPTNPPRVKMQSRSGSSSLWGKLIGESLVYLQRDTRILREFIYSFDRNKFVTPSLVSMADAVLASGVKQCAVIQQPEPTLFCVMNDGRLLTFTFDKDQGVTAWAEHLTAGSFESVATTYGGGNVADEVWFVVKRSIGGSDIRFIEQFDPLTLQGAPYASPNELFYTDCSIHIVNETATATIIGLDHLNGATVVGIADGVAFGPVVVGAVSGGIGVVLATAVTDVVVGLPFTAEVQGMKLDLQTQDGTIQGQQQKLSSAHVRLYQSNGAEHNSNPDDTSIPWSSADMGDIADVANRQVDPKDFKLDTASRYRKEINLSIRSSSPLPLNILGIIYDFESFDHS